MERDLMYAVAVICVSGALVVLALQWWRNRKK